MTDPRIKEVWKLYQANELVQPDDETFDRALRLADEVIRDGVASAELHNTVWHIHYLRGEHDKALNHLEQALRLSPASSSIHYHLGLTRRARGELSAAIAAFTRARELADAAGDEDTVDAVEHHLAELER